MLTYEGKVESVSGNAAIVQVNCGGNCEHCGACSSKQKTIEATNNIGAKAGNNVVISISNFKQKWVSALCYVLPVAITLILALALMKVVSTLILSLTCLICFIFLCGCGIIISSKLTKNVEIKIIEIKGD